VSFEDDLMVRFGTDRAKLMLQRVGFDEDVSIRNKMLSNSIESAQKRVEGNNFDIRKTLLEYDNVINEQRMIIYEKRNQILDLESIHELTLESFKNFIEDIVYSHLDEDDKLNRNDKSEILETINDLLRNKVIFDEIEYKNSSEIVDYLYERLIDEYEEKIKKIPGEITNEFEKAIMLRVVDTHWMEHINTMAHLREGIHLRSYAQNNPLREYKNEGYVLFDELLAKIDAQSTTYLLKAEVRQNSERKKVAEGVTNEDKSTVKKASPKRVAKIGRNDKCPCGSGKKYKQCCGK